MVAYLLESRRRISKGAAARRPRGLPLDVSGNTTGIAEVLRRLFDGIRTLSRVRDCPTLCSSMSKASDPPPSDVPSG